MKIHIFILCWIFEYSRQADQDYYFPYQTRSDCKSDTEDVFHQFYDFSQLKCTDCTQNSTQQTISEDGLSCICTGQHKRNDFVNSDGKFIWRCSSCAQNEIASDDGYSCISCNTGLDCPQCSAALDLTVERDLDGERLVNSFNLSTRTCVSCEDNTSPISTEENRCSRCSQILSVQPTRGCVCGTNRQAGGLCFRKESDLVDDTSTLYTVFYGVNGELSVISGFLYNNVRSSHAACVDWTSQDTTRNISEYSNLTACQLIGNACVMTGYSQVNTPQNTIYDPCSLLIGLVITGSSTDFPSHGLGYHGITNWKSNMPWLFYELGKAVDILDDSSITVMYTPGMHLDFVAAKYTPEGEFLGIVNISAKDLHVCLDENERLDKAFEFGIGYKKECEIFLGNLLENPHYDLYFYDLFLQYVERGEVRLHAIPILITNYKDNQHVFVNQEADRNLWQLTRRFYVVDRLTGVPTDGGTPEFIRYAETMKLHIRLQKDKDGLIYSPYLEITYNEVVLNDIERSNYIKATFLVSYAMDVSNFDTGIAVATGILCGLAVLYAAMRTFTWNKREGKMVLDFMFLIVFIVYTCGALANAFFTVTLGFTITWFALYKGQSVFYMVPDDQGVFYIQAFLGTAFALKTIQLMYIIIHQVTVDIFLVDWERPRRFDNNDMALEALRGQDITDEIAMAVKKDKNSQVSVWRTYFVANEWNEIQTVRRVQPVIHMLLVLLILYGIGVEELARYEPQSTVTTNDGTYHGEYNLIFRFPIFAVTFILVAIAQRLFYWLLWSRFKEHPINNFIDLCSLTNISVFVMSQSNFGYYIHGRSPHGHADVDLRKTREDILREEEDLCGSRGLIPGEDQQTFEFAIPTKFRTEYNKVLLSYTMKYPSNMQQTPRAATRITVDMEKKIQAYQILNRFIQNYLDHNIKDLDYVVARKNFTEKVLDTELKDSTYIGYFFYDYGHAFDKALFYGHEATLQIFEILFFTVVDMLAYDYVLAGILTYLLDLFIVSVRKVLGKRNVAKKTMVDDRFLI